VPDRIVLVVGVPLFHGVSLALELILNVEAGAKQTRMALHVVLVHLGPQLHLPLPTCCAGLAEEWRLARARGQARSAAEPAVVSAVNGVELIEGAVPAVTAHLTAGLALAVDITIAV
jgi:hypothetical protein